MTIFFITILVAMALHSIYIFLNLFFGTNKTINITRIAFIFGCIVVFISLSTIYIQTIGSDVMIYNSIFHVTMALPATPIKTNNKNSITWIENKVKISSQVLLTKAFIKYHINIFWNDVMNKIKDNQHVLFILRLQFSNGQIRTLNKMVKLTKNDLKFLLDLLNDKVQTSQDGYKTMSLNAIIFAYAIVDGKISSNLQNNSNVKLHTIFNRYKLPITLDALEYGTLIYKDNINNIFIMRINKTNVATIRCTDNINYVSIDRDGLEPITYKDIKIDSNTFIRQLNSIEYRYHNKELVLSTKKVRTKFMDPIEKSTEESTNFLTLDIETKLRNNTHIPYLISYFDGSQSKSFYINDFNNHEDMIIAAIKSLMIKQYNKSNIYIHNLANFDGIFLLKILSKIGLTNPIFHKGKLVQITFKLNKIKIIFRDSLQMLPISLRKLAKSFGVLNKSYFPHLFVNQDNINFDYNGNVPDFSLFTDITQDEYNEYKANFTNNWSLKDESIKYCNVDCISLHQIIDKFSELIFNNFYVNIHDYATLSSLAFAIFRSNFLPKDTVVQLSGEISNNIRKGYTGGSVDMYIPRGDNILAYDVNSLYPAVMKNNVFPINNPVYFSGNIRDIFPDAFGYFYCKVTAPLNLQYPVLQTHVETKDGIRTLAGLGTFEMMIFSAEMDNAIKFGYTFEILWGYTFDKANIFHDYVSILYEMRKTYAKTDPMNLIAKLLLNSLYGKFGMDDLFSTFDILDNKLFESIIKNDNVNVLDVIPIADDIKMVESISVKKLDNNLINPENQVHNVNIAIASAVTAYARMYMANVMFEIEKLGINIYYKDTDSLYTDKPIPEHLISSTELGLFKLEYICNNAIFLAPKVYCLNGIDGDSTKFLYKVKGLSSSINLNVEDFELYLKFKN